MGKRPQRVELLAVAGIIVICGAVVWPVVAPVREHRPVVCPTRLKQLHAALEIYASDNNETYPLADWMDATSVFTRNDLYYRCMLLPRKENGPYCIALYECHVARKLATFEPQEVVLFESTDLKRNAVSTLDTLAFRYKEDSSWFVDRSATM